MRRRLDSGGGVGKEGWRKWSSEKGVKRVEEKGSKVTTSDFLAGQAGRQRG